MDKEPMIEVNRRLIGEMVLELLAENKQLKEANFNTHIEFSKLADKEHKYLSEIRQLKIALRNASCGTIACRFCNTPIRIGHKDDCEYERLIQESEDK